MSWITPVTLRGKRVTLIPLAMEHCADLMAATKDGELWKLWYATVQGLRMKIIYFKSD